MTWATDTWQVICATIDSLEGAAQLADFSAHELYTLNPPREAMRRFLGVLEDWCILPIWLDQHGYYHLEDDWQRRLDVMLGSREMLISWLHEVLSHMQDGRGCAVVSGQSRCRVAICHRDAQHFSNAASGSNRYCQRERLRDILDRMHIPPPM